MLYINTEENPALFIVVFFLESMFMLYLIILIYYMQIKYISALRFRENLLKVDWNHSLKNKTFGWTQSKAHSGKKPTPAESQCIQLQAHLLKKFVGLAIPDLNFASMTWWKPRPFLYKGNVLILLYNTGMFPRTITVVFWNMLFKFILIFITFNIIISKQVWAI